MRNNGRSSKQKGPSIGGGASISMSSGSCRFRCWNYSTRRTRTQTCDRRDENVVPTQALVLMNDEFMAEQAGQFAERILRDVGDDAIEQAKFAVQAALGRPAAKNEVAETVAFLRAQIRVISQREER